MSEDKKQNVKDAKEFFKQVEEGAKVYREIIKDNKLGEKLKKVEEGSKEVIKHIEEKLKDG
jgi:hypothetical protein